MKILGPPGEGPETGAWPTPAASTVTAPPPPAAVHEDVQFTVYRPNNVRPARWYLLLAFAHRGGLVEDDDGNLIDPVQMVERQARALLSDQEVPFDSVRTDATEAVSIGSDLVLEPWLEQGEFNPPRATIQWVEHVHRVEFRMRVPDPAAGRPVRGGLRVFSGPVLIGELTFRIPVRAPPPAPQDSVREAVRPFRQIFASYSHLDTEVVQAVARYVGATGDRYFIDVQNLRSGERWERRLEELIDEADVFQLFWSRNAMRSRFVRQELEYALRPGRDYFVRPVYWEEPLPTDEAEGLPPAEVLALHFSLIGVPASVPVPAPAAAAPVQAPVPMPAQAPIPPMAAARPPPFDGMAASPPPPPPGMATPPRAASAKRSPVPLIAAMVIVVLIVLVALAL